MNTSENLGNSAFEYIISQRWLQHGIFWLVSFLLLLKIFAYQNLIQKIDWIYAGMFHISLILLVYIQTQILIPYFLKKNQYFSFIAFSICLMILCAGLNRGVMDWLSPRIFKSYFFISGLPWLDTIGIMAIYSVTSTLLKMSKSWAKIQVNERKLMDVDKARQTAELKTLRAQIQPHFIMNNLNSMYGMALRKDEKTAEAIMQLSSSMRYLLYESNEDLVPLSDEISFINKYVALEKRRTDFPDSIVCEWTGDAKHKMIPPLLLLALVENAFKHGTKSGDQKINVQIIGAVVDNHFQLEVSNQSKQKSEDHIPGIGLQNLRQRLELLFPKSHVLNINDTSTIFNATLNFPLQ